MPEPSDEELDALVEEAAISVLDLPLPEPPPKGAQWIAAYRRWAGGR